MLKFLDSAGNIIATQDTLDSEPQFKDKLKKKKKSAKAGLGVFERPLPANPISPTQPIQSSKKKAK